MRSFTHGPVPPGRLGTCRSVSHCAEVGKVRQRIGTLTSSRDSASGSRRYAIPGAIDRVRFPAIDCAPSMSEPLIDVAGLTKRFRVSAGDSGAVGGSRTLRSLVARRKVVTALDEVSFRIGAGELVGYIGPNGAGKSTTVKILSGILVPDAGRCLVAGRVPWRERVEHVAEIGVVFGQRSQLWWDLPVFESFDLLRDIYRLRARPRTSADARRAGGTAGDRPAAGGAGAAAQPGAAHALRAGRGAAAPPAAAVPGRAHHRPGRGGQAGGARHYPPAAPPRRHHHPHHPRPG